MKLTVKTTKRGFRCQLAADGSDSASTSQLYQHELPAFKSGDRWIADVGVDEAALTIVSVWINPENGTISVTPFGGMRRRPFTFVTRWLIQLDLG